MPVSSFWHSWPGWRGATLRLDLDPPSGTIMELINSLMYRGELLAQPHLHFADLTATSPSRLDLSNSGFTPIATRAIRLNVKTLKHLADPVLSLMVALRKEPMRFIERKRNLNLLMASYTHRCRFHLT